MTDQIIDMIDEYPWYNAEKINIPKWLYKYISIYFFNNKKKKSIRIDKLTNKY